MSVWKGCAAGIAGGLLGSFVMAQVHSALQKAVAAPQPEGEDSTVKTASLVSREILHRELSKEEKQKAGPIVHYAFGASVGGIYGAAAEFAPAVSAGFGALFGLAVCVGAHVIAVPALGLAKPITQSSPREEFPEWTAHVAYGCATEGVRRAVKWMTGNGAQRTR